MAGPPKICVPIVSESPDFTRIAPLVDFYEVRIDLIGKAWRNVVPQLTKPWIACNRRTEEGGKWRGGESKRIKELADALELGAGFIDLELGMLDIEKTAGEFKGRANLIISYHNFKETPPVDRLRQIVINQLAAGADICKVVTTARNVKDNLQILELIGYFPDVKIISFAMGSAGQISRIRAHTALPIAVGFGISNPAQAKFVAREADGVVVGSAVVNQIAQHGKSPELVAKVSAFVKNLADAVKFS